MLDIKLLRNHFDEVEKALATRNEDFDLSKFKELDDRRRALLGEMESKKAEQKKVSKQIPMKKKAGEDVTEILAEMKVLSEDVKNLNTQVSEVEAELNAWMLTIPNIPNPSVPEGNSDEDNVEIRKFGEPTKFDFEPKAHWDLGKDLGILDPETAAKISGTRFTVYRDLGARLERAITNFFLDTHTSKHGYTEVFPPFMVSRESMTGTGQLPKFEEDAYKVIGDGKEYFLVPTAEVPVTNMYREQILDGAQLPIKHCAYTACFRAEAGSAGRDTRGLIRQHQFNKVELVKFTKPEDSYDERHERRLFRRVRHASGGGDLPYGDDQRGHHGICGSGSLRGGFAGCPGRGRMGRRAWRTVYDHRDPCCGCPECGPDNRAGCALRGSQYFVLYGSPPHGALVSEMDSQRMGAHHFRRPAGHPDLRPARGSPAPGAPDPEGRRRGMILWQLFFSFFHQSVAIFACRHLSIQTELLTKFLFRQAEKTLFRPHHFKQL